METTFDSVFDLGSTTIIAGGETIFNFFCVDGNGAPVNLTGATCSLKMSPYGFPSVVTLSKSGVISSAVEGIFRVTLTSNDTKDLFGVYQFQPRIVAFDSTQYQPAMGLLNVLGYIQ